MPPPQRALTPAFVRPWWLLLAPVLTAATCDDPVDGPQGALVLVVQSMPSSGDDEVASLARMIVTEREIEASWAPDATSEPRWIKLDSAGGVLTIEDDEHELTVGYFPVPVGEIRQVRLLLDRVELDVILLAGRYTLLEQDDALPLIERCRRTGTRLVIGGPYNSGILVEGSGGARHFDYAPPPRSVVARVAALEQACAAYGVPLPAAALQFPLRDPQVACVIPGLVGREQLEATLRYAGWPVPDALWAACRTAAASREVAA